MHRQLLGGGRERKKEKKEKKKQLKNQDKPVFTLKGLAALSVCMTNSAYTRGAGSTAYVLNIVDQGRTISTKTTWKSILKSTAV